MSSAVPDDRCASGDRADHEVEDCKGDGQAPTVPSLADERAVREATASDLAL
jgi:hypothetical protein